MSDNENIFYNTVSKTVYISASTSKVWDSITKPELMKLWMLDTEINITSDWQVGSSIIFKGNLHWINFENKGTILQLEPEIILEYSFWSTLSEQSDKPENYSVVTFRLNPLENGTTLTFTQGNFATETEYKHSNFYWNVSLEILKKFNEI